MEKAVNRTKRVEGFTEKRRLFHSEPTSFFREYDNANLLNMRTEGMPRTQLNTECSAFVSKQKNILCVNGILGSIARRQFVPTNCACSPHSIIGEIKP